MTRPAYGTVHNRLTAVRGRAKDHPCTGCGGPAHDWALTGVPKWTDPRPYTDDMDAYAAMCRRCHNVMDRPRLATECMRGHPWTEQSTHITPEGGRVCRECRRLDSARIRAERGAIPATATHCRSGRHEWTPENTYTYANGTKRTCLSCKQESDQRNRKRRSVRRTPD